MWEIILSKKAQQDLDKLQKLMVFREFSELQEKLRDRESEEAIRTK